MSEPVLMVSQLGFAGVGAWLAHIDIAEHRLPNRILLPQTLALVALCSLAAGIGGSPAVLARAVGGALALGAGYGLLRAASRGALGAGDVKLAVPVGLLLAWDGWIAFAVGSALAFVVGGVWAMAMLATGRGTRSTQLPFGPCMILGAVVGCAVT